MPQDLNFYTDSDTDTGLRLSITVQDNNTLLIGVWDDDKQEGSETDVFLNKRSIRMLKGILNALELEP